MSGFSGGPSLPGNNTFTGSNTFTATITGTFSGAGSAGTFLASAATASYGWNATGGATDQKNWDAYTTGALLIFRAVNDASNAANNWMVVTRGAGAAIDNVSIPNLHAGLFQGYLSGLTLSTAGGSATFGIAAGIAVDSTNVGFISLASAYTKTTGAWAVGSTSGSLDTGAIASGSLYYVYLIKRPDTGVVDILTSLSATAPTLPTNYTLFRRIGAMRTLAGVVWAGFTQRGDNFYLSVGISNANNTSVGITRVLITTSAPPSTRALIRAYAFNSASADVGFLIQPTFETDRAPGAYMSIHNEVANQGDSGHFDIPVDASSQFAIRASVAASGCFVETFGWVDDRGRL